MEAMAADNDDDGDDADSIACVGHKHQVCK